MFEKSQHQLVEDHVKDQRSVPPPASPFLMRESKRRLVFSCSECTCTHFNRSIFWELIFCVISCSCNQHSLHVPSHPLSSLCTLCLTPSPPYSPAVIILGALLWSVPGSFYCSCLLMQEKTPTDHLIKSLIKSPAADEPALSWTLDVFESKGSFLLFLTFTFLLLTVTVETLWISQTWLSSWWSFSDLNYVTVIKTSRWLLRRWPLGV